MVKDSLMVVAYSTWKWWWWFFVVVVVVQLVRSVR